MLAVRKVAQLLGVCTATVYRLCERGEIRYVRVSNAIRIPADAVRAFIARNASQRGGQSG